MKILVYGAGVIGGKQHEKRRIQKNCQLLNLQKQQEDMKVTMRVFTKCVRRTIRIFWKN